MEKVIKHKSILMVSKSIRECLHSLIQLVSVKTEERILGKHCYGGAIRELHVHLNTFWSPNH